MNACITAFAYNNPDMKILEMGAGTGGATVPLIDTPKLHGEQEVGAARFYY